MVLDDEDERLWFKANGSFEAEVVPAEEDEEPTDSAGDGEWRRLSTPDELVEFYDPTDVFGDFAEALAEHFPAVDEDDEEEEDADEEADDAEDDEADEEDASDEDDDKP